ncbi:accessory gene regulator B family protein [Paenibacillus ihuae]|uniref:accessory gene regulator B family protein n=1 Tax=Paenibacillus ihuae TaxID=1232431 RepID=UPI0006D539BA
MIEMLVNMMSKRMVHHKVIMQKELSIIQYGLQAMIETLLIFCTMIIFSIFMGRFLEALAWVGTVFLIRSLRGGRHAGTFLQCYFISVGTFVFCMIAIHFFQHQFILYRIIWGAALLLLVCSLVSLGTRSGQENAQKIGTLINCLLLLAYGFLIFLQNTNPILLASLLGLTVSQLSNVWKREPNPEYCPN